MRGQGEGWEQVWRQELNQRPLQSSERMQLGLQ
jgi:hypothetical protein